MLNLSDLNDPSGMYSDLITEFIKNGHEVYPVASATNAAHSFLSCEKNINVLRVKTFPLLNINPISKGIANVLLPFQYKRSINKFLKNVNPELIIMPTPPVTLVGVVKELKKQYGSRFYLILRDIFPANAVDLGLIKKSGILHWFFRKQERDLYRLADTIGCMSKGNIDYLKIHNPDLNESKLHVLMNFQKPTDDDSLFYVNFRSLFCLENKFIVLFGGNMGIPQKIENVLALAQKCLVFKDVVFLLVGDGTQRRRIEKLANKYAVPNIIFKDSLSRKEYLILAGHCDVGLISLNEKFTIPNFPSKTMSYFDAGLPVLASVDNATDYGSILEKSGAGLISEAGDIDSFFANFCTLYNSPELRKKMGKNGREFLNEYMTVEVAYRTIMNHV